MELAVGTAEESKPLNGDAITDTKVDMENGGRQIRGEESKTAFDLVIEGKFQKFEDHLTEMEIRCKEHDLDDRWIEEVDKKGRNILHWAVEYKSRNIARIMTSVILKHRELHFLPHKSGRDAKKFLADVQEKLEGETPLHLAAKKGRSKIVQDLLSAEPDWNIYSTGKVQKTSLDYIYANVPEAVIHQLDNSVQFPEEPVSDGDEHDAFCDELVTLDFGSIIGDRTDADKDDKLKEANRLGGLMTDQPEKFKPILEHPLVQVFLYIKYHKAYPVILVSIAAHVLWQLIYGYFLFNIYFQVCPWKTSNGGNSTPGIEIKMECDGESLSFPGIPMAALVWILGIVFFIKEAFEMYTVPWHRYITQLENVGQLFGIGSVVLTCWPIYQYLGGIENPVMDPWQYTLAAASEFTIWALILGQICKLQSLRIYIQIFVKVFKSFFFFICTFAALLLGFASAFCIMMPEAKAFKSPWLAVPKVLVMMTGELNYDEVFHSGDEDSGGLPSHYITLQVFFSLFTIVMSLILLNLLIGLAVTDTQELKENCHSAMLSSMLEEVYLLESFAVRVFRVLNTNWILHRLKISNSKSNPKWLESWRNKNDNVDPKLKNVITLEFFKTSEYPFPWGLMNDLKKLAEKKVDEKKEGSLLIINSHDHEDIYKLTTKVLHLNTFLIKKHQEHK